MTTVRTAPTSIPQRSRLAASSPAGFSATPLGQECLAARDAGDRWERSLPGRILGGPVGVVVAGAVLCAPGAAVGADVLAVVGGAALTGAAIGTGCSAFALLMANVDGHRGEG